MKTVKIIGIVLASSVLIFITLMYLDIIWKSPSYYKVQDSTALLAPIVDMKDYDPRHPRPYCYTLSSQTGGKVYILGIDHTKDPEDSQLDTIINKWDQANPTVALIEGRLGFLFSWFQDPVVMHGEGGLVAKLVKQNGIPLYSWEPTREDEIELLLKQFPAEQLVMFYTFRPYFSNMRHGKPEIPEEQLQEYLESRTAYAQIRGIYSSWKELDSIWQIDFPHIEWRDYSDEYGWPEGYLSEIANQSNLARDHHLVQSVLDLVQKGETVFVTMGSSHAPRIEEALRRSIQ